MSRIEYSYVGKSIPRVDALEKVTGEAIFSADIHLPGMLIGKIKSSPYPFARILSINTDRAKKLPGVRQLSLPRTLPSSLTAQLFPMNFRLRTSTPAILEMRWQLWLPWMLKQPRKLWI